MVWSFTFNVARNICSRSCKFNVLFLFHHFSFILFFTNWSNFLQQKNQNYLPCYLHQIMSNFPNSFFWTLCETIELWWIDYQHIGWTWIPNLSLNYQKLVQKVHEENTMYTFFIRSNHVNKTTICKTLNPKPDHSIYSSHAQSLKRYLYMISKWML
jgi:hypothetical protein